MDYARLLMLALFVASGLALVGLSVPLIQGRVKPNSAYGFRVRRTLENPAVWYAANRYTAWRMLWLGVTVVVAATALYFILHVNFAAYAMTCLALLLAGLAAVLLQSFQYLRRLDDGGQLPQVP